MKMPAWGPDVASCSMRTGFFAPPGDAIRLESNDERVFRLAEKLWDRSRTESPERRAINLRVTVRPGPAPGPLPERDLAWEQGEKRYVASVSNVLVARIDPGRSRMDAEVTDGLLDAVPSFAARTLLEAPTAVLLCHRGFAALHAGAVVGPRGAVVLRGAAGAGKSTLVAAAWRAGFGVLADESLLVSRADSGQLAASVRDLTVLPDSERLLGLEGVTEDAFAGGEAKRRIDLTRDSTPEMRVARRAATLLLGVRSPGPARLVALGREEFLEAFREGEIPQENLGGDSGAVAEAWAGRESWRLDGAIDLEGAVSILRRLAA
ncbi:MAG TPA: hypothetical protein VE129_18385 [Thermoanaerobaculia bacterium]|nr:hypothetical protein [Thermoanaerobaculia bacterium]